jgi:hypothetical protein
MATLEIIVFLVALLLPASILLKRARWLGGSAWSSLALVLLVGVIGSVFLQPDNGNRQKRQLIADASTPVKQLVPRQQRENGYQTSDRCRSCHPKEHASWHHSFHRSMTQLVGPDNVLGDFNDRRLTQGGFEYVLHWEGDRLLVDMPDPDVYLITEGGELELGGEVLVDEIKMVEDLPVVMMTGSHSFQGYWVPSSQGLKLIQFPWIYNILDKRWMPSQDAFIRPPDGRKRVAVWNENCIQCHALGGNPNEIGESGVLMSTVAELGISCEACHGPAEQHVAYYQNPLNRYLQHLAGGEPQHILNPADLAADVSTQVCGQCHSSFFPRPELDYMHKGNPFRPGDELEKTHHIIHYGDEESRAESREIADGGYWKDGTIRVGGREYNALVMSPCYKNATDSARQISCLSCHQMHSDATRSADLDKWRDDQLGEGMQGDQACLQCHAQYQQTEALEQHTHHAADSSGSRCYNCHMPFTSYALLKGIRGHRVTVPSVDLSSTYQKPNACNQCHLDQTLAWTAEHLEKRYQIQSEPLSEEHHQTAASILWLTHGDAALRAITAWTYGWDAARQISGDQWMAPPLAYTLDDPYSAVRYIAGAALEKIGPSSDIGYDFVAQPAERRAVRDQVLQSWKNLQRDLPEDRGGRCLLLPGGELDQARLLELLQKRDDSEQTWLPE